MNILLVFVGILSLYQTTATRAGNRNKNFCPTLQIKNGRTRPRGMFMQFICQRGFTLVGEKYSKCLSQRGVWDNEPPKCVKGTCVTTPKSPAHGYTYMSHKKAVYNFFCEPGYELLGPKTTFCDGKLWDAAVPTCILSGKQPELACDFENADLCGWNHDANHDFDWTRHQRQTPSWYLGTGPYHDITKGPGGDGFYMYTEATSKNVRDTARLISPIYERSNDTEEYCFEFFYHMYGSQTGDLSVYTREVSSGDGWNLTNATPVFFKTGDQENAWHYSIVRIGLMKDEFQVIFEARRGPGYLSDIAIDNVRLIPDCTDEDQDLYSSSTTEIYDYTYEAVESCVNRCGEGLFSTMVRILEGVYQACDCDVSCFNNGTCCPDFEVECLMSSEFPTSTDDYTWTTDNSTWTTDNSTWTTDYYTETLEDTESTLTETDTEGPLEAETSTISNDNVVTTTPTEKRTEFSGYPITKNSTTGIDGPTTEKPAVVDIKGPTIRNITSTIQGKIPTIRSNISKKPTSSFKKTTGNSRKTTGSGKKTTGSSKKTTGSSKKTTGSSKRITSSSKKTTSNKKITILNKTTTRSKNSGKKTTKKTLKTTTKPRVTTNVVKGPSNGPQLSDVAEVPRAKEFPEDTNEVYEGKADPSVYNGEAHLANHRTALIIGVVAGCVFVCLAVAFLIQRYVRRMGSGGFMRRSYRGSGQGDSQSDVRYLTSHEVLDFRLGSPAASQENDMYHTF